MPPIAVERSTRLESTLRCGESEGPASSRRRRRVRWPVTRRPREPALDAPGQHGAEQRSSRGTSAPVILKMVSRALRVRVLRMNALDRASDSADSGAVPDREEVLRKSRCLGLGLRHPVEKPPRRRAASVAEHERPEVFVEVARDRLFDQSEEGIGQRLRIRRGDAGRIAIDCRAPSSSRPSCLRSRSTSRGGCSFGGCPRPRVWEATTDAPSRSIRTVSPRRSLATRPSALRIAAVAPRFRCPADRLPRGGKEQAKRTVACHE